MLLFRFQNLLIPLRIQNPNLPNPPTNSIRSSITLIRQPLVVTVMATPTKIIAEYAKSNRSTCKKCSNSISANSLRLGLYSKDPRGYDVTKWHHLNCFPSDSLQPIIHGSAQSIQGFSSLKIGDQEALEKLTAGCDLESKQGSDHGEKEVEEGNEEKSSKKSKVDKVDEHGQEGEQKKMKVIAEYAKSNRSSCKQCTKPIPSKTLRLGLVSSDRGFDMTKWHHLRCLSTVPLQVDSVDEIDGFPSLKSNHQEALKKLLNGEPLPIEVFKEDEAAIDELQSKSKTSKPSAKIVTEYAKSSRSSCKKCSEVIPAKSLRIGSISKERGHDVTRWYHPTCFPTDSQPSSVDEIDGFSSLKTVDQEALQKVMDGCDQLPKEVVVEGSDGQSSREFKVRKTDETVLDEGKESSSKKLKVAELEIAFSISDVQKQYKESKLSPNWKAFQTLIFLERDEGLRDSGKIAAFDFDGCLANTDVRRIGADAWSLMFQSIPEKLNSLYKDGYKLVIFTNESNIERWKNKRQVAIDSKIGRLKKFIDCVKVPIQVFIACGFDSAGKGKDLFRKPNTGMWRLMEQQFNSGIPIDMDQSFYVGDAAGRKDDHSDADIKFAEAIGLKFHLPEDFFAA
ncbi:hypothetical protein C5167_048216 [Papaver somniferum]|uniref:PARP-type domain-containing protein n=1 Tax=Papaver somniferum TaxID=3469 RepID=A0A4Y7KLA9_PAPSO|nr:polynucleotide 3'-phosphatase ZDP-like [Papaver somniferum]RZC72739.1 hypothetical protein C5167_048216 [Papaver somniferum]